MTDIAPRCGTFPLEVNPDASRLLARPAGIGTASAAANAFVGLALSVDIADQPLEPNSGGPPDCSPSSSTDCRDHTASTPSSACRTTRKSVVARRPWVRCLSHRSTSQVRVGLRSPILSTGLVPCGGSGFGLSRPLGPLPVSFQQRIIAQLQPLPRQPAATPIHPTSIPD